MHEHTWNHGCSRSVGETDPNVNVTLKGTFLTCQAAVVNRNCLRSIHTLFLLWMQGCYGLRIGMIWYLCCENMQLSHVNTDALCEEAQLLQSPFQVCFLKETENK